jgi:hypothetical protein
VLRASVERRLSVTASVGEAMRLIEDHLSSVADPAPAARSRGV